jgi:DNA-binding transcriptional LysR family regulator
LTKILYTEDLESTIGLVELRTFLAVAEARSFTRAAVRLRQDKSLVSRRVRTVEASLGVSLFVRTTRSVRLTAEGEQLVCKLAPLLAGLDAALGDSPARAAIPSGTVTITSTPDLGRNLLAPALVSFRVRYPAVRVSVVLLGEFVDLMRADVDLALRVGKPGGRELIARRVGALDAGLFASPAYLERRGTPHTLDELGRHERLWPTPAQGQRTFAPGKPPPPADIECADFGLLAELARLGGGIALLPTFVAARDVATGTLIRVLPTMTLGGAPLYLVSRPLRPMPARVTALRDHLREVLRAFAS